MSSTPSSQTSSGIAGGPFMFGEGHKNVAFAPNTSLWSGPTPPTWCATSYQSAFGSPVAVPSVFMPGNHRGDSFASNHLATPTWTSTGTSSRPSYKPTKYDGPVSTSGGNRATSKVEKLVSISAMLAYKTISHEELRLEDYMNRKGGSGTNLPGVLSNKMPFPKITPPSIIKPCARDPIYQEKGFNPFAPRPSLTCPASTVSPFSFNFKIPFPKITSSFRIEPCTGDPLYTFNPKTKTWCDDNPFANPSTSPPNQPSFPGSPIPTSPLFTRDLKIAPVSSEPISFISKPITLVSPCVPSTQKCDDQSSASQLSSSHINTTPSLANPFGTLPPSPQSSYEHSRSKPIQYGISSIPVKDKPAPVRCPLPTTRHISRGCKLPVRKYEPKSSVPFFLNEL